MGKGKKKKNLKPGFPVSDKKKDLKKQIPGKKKDLEENIGQDKKKFVLAAVISIISLLVLFILYLQIKPAVNLERAPEFNIVFISLDTTRADHLGCYGYKRARTPNIDKLAQQGIMFANAYCSAPLTLPSHTSIFTGMEPVRHGVRNNGHYLASEIRTITQDLKERGYNTAAFVSSFSVDSRFGLDRGFDLYDDNFQANLPFKTLNAERRAEDTFIRFARWLENNHRNKFFCWVHFFDPHLPYSPPSPFKEDFADHLYDGEIAYMDVYLGKIVEALSEKGLLERTIIIIAGDHGEGLGDKVEQGHGIFLYEETVRVPLIFFNKNIWPKARIIKQKVRLVDIAPTISEFAGLKDDSALKQGLSLIPLMNNKERRDREVLLESIYPRENFGWSELTGVISGHWKYIQGPKPELYNLENDPEERNNLVAFSIEKAEELKKKLEKMLASYGSKEKNYKSGATKEDIERLRSLGYLNFAPAKPGSDFPDPKERLDLLRLIQQAQIYEYEEKWAEAEQIYMKICSEIPDSPYSYVNLAISQARQKKMEEAISSLRKGLERVSESEVLMVRLGHTYLVTGRVAEAFETMRKVLQINPKNVDAITVCAGILDTSGKKEEARLYYEKALEIEPESKFLRMSYAGNLASTGRLQEAIEVYKKLIGDYPDEQAFYQFTGIAYSYLGDFSQAIFYLRQAVAIKPTPAGYFNLAVAYEKSGDINRAIEYFKLYLENSKDDDPRMIAGARAELERLEKLKN